MRSGPELLSDCPWCEQHMAYPKQSDVELPLLRVLLESGGSAKPRDLYSKVAVHFPDLSAEEQEERLESTPNTR